MYFKCPKAHSMLSNITLLPYHNITVTIVMSIRNVELLRLRALEMFL